MPYALTPNTPQPQALYNALYSPYKPLQAPLTLKPI